MRRQGGVLPWLLPAAGQGPVPALFTPAFAPVPCCPSCMLLSAFQHHTHTSQGQQVGQGQFLALPCDPFLEPAALPWWRRLACRKARRRHACQRVGPPSAPIPPSIASKQFSTMLAASYHAAQALQPAGAWLEFKDRLFPLPKEALHKSSVLETQLRQSNKQGPGNRRVATLDSSQLENLQHLVGTITPLPLSLE